MVDPRRAKFAEPRPLPSRVRPDVAERVGPCGAGPRAPRGGDGAAGALPLTRLAACPWGISRPGFSTSMPGSKARSKGIFYVLSREHQLARADVAAKQQFPGA